MKPLLNAVTPPSVLTSLVEKLYEKIYKEVLAKVTKEKEQSIAASSAQKKLDESLPPPDQLLDAVINSSIDKRLVEFGIGEADMTEPGAAQDSTSKQFVDSLGAKEKPIPLLKAAPKAKNKSSPPGGVGVKDPPPAPSWPSGKGKGKSGKGQSKGKTSGNGGKPGGAKGKGKGKPRSFKGAAWP